MHFSKPSRAGPSVVIVGSSIAGMAAAEELRHRGHEGSIVMLDADPELPYNRPPLSKEFLTGEFDEDDIRLVTPEHLSGLEVDLRLGTPAQGLDLVDRCVRTPAGPLPFDSLLIATGSAALRPRGWPVLDGVYALRSIRDARAIRSAMTHSAPRVVIIGGGFIGCEIAAAATAHNLDVTIVEALTTPMQRVLGPDLAEPIVRLHRQNGVRFLCGIGVAQLLGTRSVEGVELLDGTVLPADLVVIGVGAAPVTEWLRGSGLDITDGVATDRTLCTGAPGVYAAGDVARWPYRGDRSIRVEHWTNAKEQGARAAGNLLDPSSAEPYVGIPYVWSDQYGSQLQIAGETHAPELRFLQGSPDDTSYLAVFLDSGRVVGAVGLDCAREFRGARRMVAEGAILGAFAD